MREYVNPNKLIFTEEMQNKPLGEVSEIYNPVVCVKTEDGLKIIDGHNRVNAAIECNLEVPYVAIEEEKYIELLELGFDDIEIAYAILIENGEHDAATALDQQFPGAMVSRRGTDAWMKI
ncbi:hypothetical protein [Acetivibrio straminisolvens]|jgi:hypothetical protein|uniref:hypothetical protein n=1 Tax=Acetivibrio straminisolvens TaxID=253314 RepID=UPI00224077A1|nr:hypothetical protein [Acetivibrio straminisolvens]